MDAEAGFNPEDGLKEIQWNIHIIDMEITEQVNLMLQKIILTSSGK